MSDSSSVQLFFVEETAWGEIPVDSPLVLSEFRFTNESLTQNTETATSEEIRSDRQVADIIRTQVGAGGDAGIELSFGSHDPLFAGALYDDFSTEVNETSVDLTITEPSPQNNTSIFTLDTGGSPDPFKNIVAGQFIRLTGSTASPTNDGFYKVISLGTGSPESLVVSPPAPSPGESITGGQIRGQFISNGTTRKSFQIEKLFSDLSPLEIQRFSGMRVGSMDLNIAPGAIINGSFTFQGKQLIASSTSIGSQTVSLSTDDVMSAVDNITDILIDGQSIADQAACFTNVQFTVENNLRDQPCIGSLALGGIGIGRTNVTGTIEAYFRDRVLFDKYLNFDTVSVSFRATLGGDSYVFDFPAVKFTSGEVVAGGNDQDVIVSLEFESKRDPASDFMVAINRIPAGTA
ncbi:MAG: hypothetical protein GY794_16315 [bacterium]|nr:hypothetical protein [bacterium]